MKVVVLISRLIVGSLFIVSGLVKANDPLGFSYKLEEYFAESALNLTWLDEYALLLASIACIAEIVLGVATLLGGRMKLTSASLLILTLFFGWLTFYTANCDPQGSYLSNTEVAADAPTAAFMKERANNEEGLTLMKEEGGTLYFEEVKAVTCVTDCGCFGDALKGSLGRSLTPWESFYKDLILFIFVLPIFFWSFKGKVKFNEQKDDLIYMGGGLVLVTALGAGVFGWWLPTIFTAICFVAAYVIKALIKNDSTPVGAALLIVATAGAIISAIYLPIIFLAAYLLAVVAIRFTIKSGDQREWAVAMAIAIISIFFTWWNYNHLPVKDYRPYKVGANIPEGMKLCHELGLPCPEYANMYIVKDLATGEEFKMRSDEYLIASAEGKVEYVDYIDEQVTIVAGYEAPIKDFVFTTSDGMDITQDILSYPGYTMLIISKDLSKLGEFEMKTINDIEQLTFTASEQAKEAYATLVELSRQGEAEDVQTIGWAANSDQQIELFRHELQLPFDMYAGDDKVLKTIIRSNPGLVLLHNGTIIGKWHYNDIPDWASMKAEYLK